MAKIYCIAIWGSCSPSTFNIFEHLHLKAAKLIHKLPSETPDTDVLDLVKWKPLVYIYKRRLASIMYYVYHDSLPDQLLSLFETRNINASYNLRRTNHFSHVRCNSNNGRNSVRYRGPVVWNLIAKTIKDASSYQLFKQKLRQASKILDQIQFEKEACMVTSKQSDSLYFWFLFLISSYYLYSLYLVVFFLYFRFLWKYGFYLSCWQVHTSL